MEYGEKLNTSTHFLGMLLAIGGSCYLLIRSVQQSPWQGTLSVAVYCCSLLLLYACSTLYHSSSGNAKEVLRKLDHYSIYLLIAGTYTPFCVLALDSVLGWCLLTAVWAAALVGIVQEAGQKNGRWLSVCIYLAMGWSAVLLVAPLRQKIGDTGFGVVLAGGLFYTLGIAFYLLDKRLRHAHGVWHVFVLLGSAAHYGAILFFVL